MTILMILTNLRLKLGNFLMIQHVLVRVLETFVMSLTYLRV